MQRSLIEMLACPADRSYPLELLEFEASGETIRQGVMLCKACGRYYPIVDEIAVMLPDELRSKKEDLEFLQRWKESLPEAVLAQGKPWNLSGGQPSN